ncbi:shikimate dehydrogenase [Bacillaceae bacterium Marseille-Q3522]|nr:shikimate dehydrogenase [Bacillaceae bacterium Marseille-Q3522]
MKKFAVIGYPIAHSLSPAMHNDLFAYYNIDAYYKAILVHPDKLGEEFLKMKNDQFNGFNITVPHKTAIIPFLDELDPLAEAIGAVNTVVNQNGKFIGYNTDGNGYMQGLLDEKLDLFAKSVLLVGAGGAARAIYYTMAQAGVKRLDICNRTVSRAKKLIEDCPYQTESKAISFSEAEQKLADYQIIVQTTTIGMLPDVDASPFSLAQLPAASVVSDIIYNPFETRFLREAREQGAFIQNGVSMFAYQGALAFEKWLGFFPDVARMKHNIEKQLGGLSC